MRSSEAGTTSNLTMDLEAQMDESEVTSQGDTVGGSSGTEPGWFMEILDFPESHEAAGFGTAVQKSFWETQGIDAVTVMNSLDDRDVFAVYNMRDGNNGTVWHWIAAHESFDNVEHLVEKLGRINKPFNLVNVGDKDGRTPLICAVVGGKELNVAYLCRKQALFAEEILPNIEDKWGKTALDYARESKQGNIVMELMKMKDVQYYEEQRHRQMQSVADKVHLVGGQFCTALGIAVFASKVLFRASNVSPMSSVSVSCSVCGAIAAFMSVAAPSDNVKAKIRYLQRLLAISCIMLLIAISALIADLFLVGKTPPFMKALGVSSIAITVLASILARLGVI